MVDFWKDFWICETGTGQQVAQLHDRYDDDDDNYIKNLSMRFCIANSSTFKETYELSY